MDIVVPARNSRNATAAGYCYKGPPLTETFVDQEAAVHLRDDSATVDESLSETAEGGSFARATPAYNRCAYFHERS